MIPEVGKFYYIDYTDHEQPEGSYFGIARCIKIHSHDEKGTPINPALYEFEHEKDGKLWASLFYSNEIIMEAR